MRIVKNTLEESLSVSGMLNTIPLLGINTRGNSATAEEDNSQGSNVCKRK